MEKITLSQPMLIRPLNQLRLVTRFTGHVLSDITLLIKTVQKESGQVE